MTESNEPNDTHIELTLDELAFIAAYFEENMNATRAYMKLHPKTSYDAARSGASLTLTNANIRGEIKRRLTEKAMSAEEALARLGEMARAELKPFIRIDDEGFTYFNFADPEAKEYLYLVKKMKTKRERRVDGKGDNAEVWEGEWVEVELYDAQSALRDILKMHGKFVDKVDITSAGEPIQTKVDDARFDRAISSLANAIRESVSGQGAEPGGAVDAGKQTAVVGVPKPGR